MQTKSLVLADLIWYSTGALVTWLLCAWEVFSGLHYITEPSGSLIFFFMWVSERKKNLLMLFYSMSWNGPALKENFTNKFLPRQYCGPSLWHFFHRTPSCYLTQLQWQRWQEEMANRQADRINQSNFIHSLYIRWHRSIKFTSIYLSDIVRRMVLQGHWSEYLLE